MLNSGLPAEIPAISLNRKCGSSLQSANFAASGIMAGMQDLIIGGGVEHMTRVPLGSDNIGYSDYINEHYNMISQGLSAELIASRWDLSREVIDQFSLESHQKAAYATNSGYFTKEIIPVPVTTDNGTEMFVKDQGIRYDSSLEKLGQLKPIFKPESGVITAGNSSQISDGASAFLMSSEEKADELGIKPLAKFISFALAAVDPEINLTAPMPATKKALNRVKLSIDDMDVIEVNEAFAPIPLAFIKDLKPDLRKINPNGGAIALGHPLGCSGAKLLTHVIYELERIKGRFGLITLCIGQGQGITTIVERF